jgi:hypothetical protein
MGIFLLQEKFPTAEPGIEPGTSWLVVRSSDHQATRMISKEKVVELILKLKRGTRAHTHTHTHTIQRSKKFYLNCQKQMAVK